MKARSSEAAKRIKRGVIGGRKVLVYPHEGTQITVMENPNRKGKPSNEDLYRLYLIPKKGGPAVLMKRPVVRWREGGNATFSNRPIKTTDPRHLAIYARFGRKAKLAKK